MKKIIVILWLLLIPLLGNADQMARVGNEHAFVTTSSAVLHWILKLQHDQDHQAVVQMMIHCIDTGEVFSIAKDTVVYVLQSCGNGCYQIRPRGCGFPLYIYDKFLTEISDD